IERLIAMRNGVYGSGRSCRYGTCLEWCIFYGSIWIRYTAGNDGDELCREFIFYAFPAADTKCHTLCRRHHGIDFCFTWYELRYSLPQPRNATTWRKLLP